MREGINALECLFSNQCECNSIDFIMKQEVNQHRCNFIGWWDYMVKRINRTRYNAIVLAYFIHWTTEKCALEHSVGPQPSSVFFHCFEIMLWLELGKPRWGSQHRHSLALGLQPSASVSLFSYPMHLIYFECTLLEQSWLLHHKPGRALRSLLAPVGAHSGINRTLALELMLISTISGNASFPASKTKNEHLHSRCSWKASIPFRSSSAHLLSLFCIEAVATLALRFLTDNPTLGMSRKANIFSFESSSFISFWLPFTINT